MSSGCEIGGDGSVQYKVVTRNPRTGTIRSERDEGGGWLQAAIDETPAKGDFKITLKVPENSTRFVKSLIKAAASAVRYAGKAGKEITFTIPIEPESPGQIQIYWESEPAKSSAAKRKLKAKAKKR